MTTDNSFAHQRDAEFICDISVGLRRLGNSQDPLGRDLASIHIASARLNSNPGAISDPLAGTGSQSEANEVGILFQSKLKALEGLVENFKRNHHRANFCYEVKPLLKELNWRPLDHGRWAGNRNAFRGRDDGQHSESAKYRAL